MKQYSKAHEVALIKTNPNKAFKRVKVTQSKDAADFARQFYFSDMGVYESLFIILLDCSNTTIAWAKISQGCVAGIIADVKIIAKYAIESLASSVILVHNHPSGNLEASELDINMSNRVKQGLGTLDVSLLDSIILTEDAYSSLGDKDLL